MITKLASDRQHHYRCWSGYYDYWQHILGNNATLNTSVSSGKAGNISLQSWDGNISVGAINATSTLGTGGQVDVTTSRLFQWSGTFTDPKGVISSI